MLIVDMRVDLIVDRQEGKRVVVGCMVVGCMVVSLQRLQPFAASGTVIRKLGSGIRCPVHIVLEASLSA